MQSYRDLRVWQVSFENCRKIYELVAMFPAFEQYGLASQMRRAAVSIPSNIAEGYYRNHRPEYIQFLRIAYGSGAELETQLLLADSLNYGDRRLVQQILENLTMTMKMLNKLLSSLA